MTLTQLSRELSREEIITKAIDKAQANGWQFSVPEFSFGFNAATVNYSIYYPMLIFKHDFAKALWGSERLYDEEGMPIVNDLSVIYDEAWQYHLMHMAVADDPIIYLGENL